jgi:hypothetical protein
VTPSPGGHGVVCGVPEINNYFRFHKSTVFEGRTFQTELKVQRSDDTVNIVSKVFAMIDFIKMLLPFATLRTEAY